MEPGPEADSAGGVAPPAAAAAAAAAAAPQEDEPSVGRAGGSGDGDEEDEALLARAQKLVSKILAARANPNPRHLHALASMLEAQESRSSWRDDVTLPGSLGTLLRLIDMCIVDAVDIASPTYIDLQSTLREWNGIIVHAP